MATFKRYILLQPAGRHSYVTRKDDGGWTTTTDVSHAERFAPNTFAMAGAITRMGPCVELHVVSV